MEKQNRLLMWSLVVVPIIAAVLAIIPPQKKLKGGIDLVGGFSLLYEIDTTGLDPSQIRGLSTKVKDVLQRRVDPNAQLNLVWRPVGNTRLEIQMPRPPQEAIERRKEYEQTLAKVEELNVGRLEIEAALSADDATARLVELGRGVAERQDKLTALQSAYADYQQVRGGDDLDAEDAARDAYEQAFAGVMATTLSPNRLTDVLALQDRAKRSEQLGRLKEAFPSYGQTMDDAVAKYDEWAADKAALEDPSDLKRLLRGAGVLEFRILAKRDPQNRTVIASDQANLRQPISKYTEQLQQRGPRAATSDHYRWFAVPEVVDFLNIENTTNVEQSIANSDQIVEQYAGKWYVLSHADSDFGLLRDSKQKWKLKSAMPDRDENGQPSLSFTLDPRGGSQFARLTGDNIGQQLCIFLDDEAMSHATIKSQIRQRGQITGRFTQQDVWDLVQILDAGSLPGRLKETPLMEKNVGPSLGRTNRELGMKAAIYGMVVVAAFILIYYQFAGVVANVALFLNLLFVLGIMATLQATFTLPGIAGLILTVGMAVDANVLIFERIREERERGVLLKRAVKTGYDKALSTIVDANLTTLITCVVLGYVGSEEVKGFAMVLGFGIVTSMFTALFVTRLIFTTLIDAGWLSELKMFRLIGRPNVDWLAMRSKFWPVSLVLVIGGLGLFITASARDKEKVYDIEFLGGTSVQIELKDDVDLSDEDVRQRVTARESGNGKTSVQWLNEAADALAKAEITTGSIPTEFVVTSDTLTTPQIKALMETKRRGQRDALVDLLEVGGVTGEGTVCRFDTKPIQLARPEDDDTAASAAATERTMTLEEFTAARDAAVEYARRAAGLLAGARVQEVASVDEQADAKRAFEIITVESSKELVQEAIVAAMSEELAIEAKINFNVMQDPRTGLDFFPVEEDDRYLSDVIGGEASFDVLGFKGGVALVFDNLQPAASVEEVERRIREIRLQPGFEQYKWRKYSVLGLSSAGQDDAGNTAYAKMALLVVDEELLNYDEADPERWRNAVAIPELTQAKEALSAQKTLRSVIQFAPQVAEQTKTQAIIAVAIALMAIVAYVWLRFGQMQFGLAAIVALVHDVSITLGFITLSDYFHGGALGSLLLIQDFKIDLPMIAAMLTIIGYSLNDTIVVFDRIRENRGKLTTLSPQMINNSINQTLSRTLLTSATTFVVVFLMYWLGGPGVHGFAYALVMGVIVGTYSSLGVATPLLYRPRLLHIIVYILAALGLFGATWVIVSNTTALIVVGLVIALALIWAFRSELRTDRDYGQLVASPA